MKTTDDPRLFGQDDFVQFVRTRIGKEPWVTVSQLANDQSTEYGFHCALVANSKVGQVLQHKSWDLPYHGGKPGCSVSYVGQEEHIDYLRFGSGDGIEPLVILRDFHGLKPRYLELCEEFRHFHDLFQDVKTGQFTKLDEDGNSVEVAKVSERVVTIRLKELKQFLAIKEMQLAIYFDRVLDSRKTLAELALTPIDESVQENDLSYARHLRDYDAVFGESKSLSRVVGKKIIQGTSKEKSGFWPYENPDDDDFDEFIIGVDENGDPVTQSCDPEKLSNYFGKNPGAPHYLTPVFFRREVLTKYYAAPARFQVEDGFLRCQGLWGLRLDNNQKDLVIVFLGDLGRDLSSTERKYWKSFNVPPEGKLSRVAQKRGFLAEFADPEAEDLLFKYRLELFHEAWTDKHGWPLFKPLSPGDSHYYTSLHTPLTPDQAEFDDQVLALAKVLVDSINEEALVSKLKTPPPAQAKGITKLDLFLVENGASDAQIHIKFLRDLYDLRHGSGHRKGAAYEKAALAFQLPGSDPRKCFQQILNRAIEFLDFLRARFLS